MKERIIEIGEGFWNIRGSFKLAGFVELGTHASLVRLRDGGFVLLDSYTLPPTLLDELDAITGGRDNVVAVLNVHPFHTLHAEAMHRDFPNAKHYGTSRHKRKWPSLDWEELTTEDPVLWERFASDFAFSIPDGVQLIPANENIHCGSILVYHRASGTIHVDDTFNYRAGRGAKAVKRSKPGKLSVHPTLASALEKTPDAAMAFREWGRAIARDWGDATQLCAAHSDILTADMLSESTLGPAMADAIERVEGKLSRHRRKHA